MNKGSIRAERRASTNEIKQSSTPAITITLLSSLAVICWLLWPTPKQPQAPNPTPKPTKHAQTSTPDKYDLAVEEAFRQSKKAAIEEDKSASPAPTNTTKQTSFTQQSYQPKPIANPYSPPTVSATNKKAQPVSNQVTTHSNTWFWQARPNDKRQGRFNWQEQNRQIIWRSVCSNYRAGSLEYRDCRKGAKQTFKRLCQTNGYRPACAAENNFLP